jgi:hypothetical protein
LRIMVRRRDVVEELLYVSEKSHSSSRL